MSNGNWQWICDKSRGGCGKHFTAPTQKCPFCGWYSVFVDEAPTRVMTTPTEGTMTSEPTGQTLRERIAFLCWLEDLDDTPHYRAAWDRERPAWAYAQADRILAALADAQPPIIERPWVCGCSDAICGHRLYQRADAQPEVERKAMEDGSVRIVTHEEHGTIDLYQKRVAASTPGLDWIMLEPDDAQRLYDIIGERLALYRGRAPSGGEEIKTHG